MKTKTFDVIIAGAGPAGASCARNLAKAGYKVLLIERSQEIGAPNFSSAGVPNYVMEKFHLPKKLVGTYWDKFEIVTKSKNHIWRYPKTRGFVLKFNELKKFLVEEAVAHGCEVLIGTAATKLSFEKNLARVTYSGITNGEALAKIVIDATGPAGTFATQYKLRSATPTPPTSGLEYIMSNVKFKNKNNLAFYIGPEFAPHGYAWIFPMGPDTAKVGLAVYETTKNKTVPIKDLLEQFIAKIGILKNAQPMELHGGTLFINGGLKKLIHKNLVIVGDSALNVNPLGAEGIRHHLYAAKFASMAAAKAIAKNNLKYLKDYERDWQKYAGKRWKISNFLTKMVYVIKSDIIFDKGLELAQNLSPAEIFDVLFEYNFKPVRKALKGNIKKELFALALKNKFSLVSLKKIDFF